MKLRAFIAVPTAEEVRDRIAKLQSRLIESDAHVKWETSAKFHITLKFLGDTEDQTLADLSTRLQPALLALPSFDIIYDALGAFPNVNQPRIVWIGAPASDAIRLVQNRVEEVCNELSFGREDRPFHPHITLGRVKGNRNRPRLTEQLKNTTFEPIQTHCTAVHIMRSELKPTGSIYTLLNSIPLKS